ncbi:uncharacterized protein MELLADRAFT_73443 [Melampsora larici-populina 98AG31]|uniref:Uncharacterized protein n=1 Tax=Melampsora larici-populina (strain 98AG31 / pathotype 3-4-7) TaxID=747676 RepID=F4S883_MELLP|nr:uncharacterized protein MELLADRAFT_73443 [Melampsora larici-populina 98AG31]EGF99160.1 hypothetical protein MELLADRAFT_73443 [Melampsora larici-populina 98AG31]
MSQFIESLIINFVTHLNPATNPYLTTADYLETLILPCPLPSWSRYIQPVIVVQLIIMFMQSSYILYIRSKTKKPYHIGLNGIAMTEIIFEQLAQSGHLDQGYSNFILGIKFTFTAACNRVKQKAATSHMTPVGKLLPTAVVWALNIFLVAIVVAPFVALSFTFIKLTIEYNQIRQFGMSLIQGLRNSASECSVGKCGVAQVVTQVIPLIRERSHIDLLVYYTGMGVDCYIFIDGFLFLIYIPFLFVLLQSFTDKRGLESSTIKTQKAVTVNTFLELAITFLSILVAVYAKTLLQNGRFILDPYFWLLVRVGKNAVISSFGNIALFLILYSLRRADVSPISHMQVLSLIKTPQDNTHVHKPHQQA